MRIHPFTENHNFFSFSSLLCRVRKFHWFLSLLPCLAWHDIVTAHSAVRHGTLSPSLALTIAFDSLLNRHAGEWLISFLFCHFDRFFLSTFSSSFPCPGIQVPTKRRRQRCRCYCYYFHKQSVSSFSISPLCVCVCVLLNFDSDENKNNWNSVNNFHKTCN